MLPVILRREAEADVRDIHAYLEDMRAGLGPKFVQRLREVMETIESAPEVHGVVWQNVRAVRLRKFRYIVYYIVAEVRVEVLAVMHGARDSSAWQSRT